MRNRKVVAALVLGASVAILMILFPPYFDVGGLFGGVQFRFILLPPTQNLALDIRPAIAVEPLLLQLCVVVGFALSGALVFEREAPRARYAIFRLAVCVAVIFTALFLEFSITAEGRGWTQAPFLLCLIPVQFPGGYFLFWLRLAALALVTLSGVFAVGYRSERVARNSALMAITAAMLGVVGLAAATAAIRFWK